MSSLTIGKSRADLRLDIYSCYQIADGTRFVVDCDVCQDTDTNRAFRDWIRGTLGYVIPILTYFARIKLDQI